MTNAAIIRHVLERYKLASAERQNAAFSLLAELIAETLEDTPEELLQTTLFDNLYDLCQTFGIPFTPEEEKE